jgi:hypothetical protein
MAIRMQTRTHLPAVNIYDVPELLPGAQPSANPAERTEFEQRCREVYDEAHYEEREEQTQRSVAYHRLQAMFPKLDADLVRDLAEQAPSEAAAVEVLLALASESSTPMAPRKPPEDVNNAQHFPTLMDAEGWEVVSRRQLEGDDEQELGSAWCDRAKAVASQPAPAAKTSVESQVQVACRRKATSSRAAKEEVHAAAEEIDVLPTEYETRQSIGQHKAWNRGKFRHVPKASLSCTKDLSEGMPCHEEHQDSAPSEIAEAE